MDLTECNILSSRDYNRPVIRGIARMVNSKIPTKGTGWKIPWKMTCGQTMTEVGRITRDSSLLLNMRGWNRLAGDRGIWRRITEGAWERCRLSRHEEQEEKEDTVYHVYFVRI